MLQIRMFADNEETIQKLKYDVETSLLTSQCFIDGSVFTSPAHRSDNSYAFDICIGEDANTNTSIHVVRAMIDISRHQ